MDRWNSQNASENNEWNHDVDGTDEEREIEFVDIDSGDLEDSVDTEEEQREEILQESRGDTPEKRITHVSLAPRFSMRQRRTQLGVTMSFFALMVLILLISYAPTRQTLTRAFTTPVTPTGTLAPGIDHFYIGGEPPWGHLLVDGKTITRLPDPIRGEPPLHLSTGTHRLTWVAPPFISQSCTVSVPPHYSTNTCDFNSFINSGSQRAGWLFTFSTTLLYLPLDVQSSLLQSVQNALDSNAPTETVHPGEVYATDNPQHPLVVATQPLIATLKYELDVTNSSVSTCSTVFIVDNQDCSYETQDCHIFCTAPQLFSTNIVPPVGRLTQAWNVLGVVSYKWDYRTLSGKLVASDQPDQPPGVTPQNHLIPLSITWDGMQWHVISSLSLLDSSIFSGMVATQMQPACASAISNVSVDPSLTKVAPSYHGTNWSYASASNAATGCLGIVTMDEGVTPTPRQTPAYCLHRFGVFLAANSVAHDYWPTMPVADAYEQKLAQQLYASYSPY